ncbi:MAG: hypothetical protein ACM3ZV_07555 [Bacillota bacterium]
MTDADRISRFANVDRELAELVVIAATRGGHSVKHLRGPCKHKELVAARRWVVARARARRGSDGRPRFSYWQIARALNRDHTTVIHHERVAIAAGGGQ